MQRQAPTQLFSFRRRRLSLNQGFHPVRIYEGTQIIGFGSASAFFRPAAHPAYLEAPKNP